MKRANLMLAAFALLLGSAGGVRADLVVNGGFETGDFTGWTTTGDYTFNGVASSGYAFGAQSGTYFAFLGSINPGSTLSQTLDTTAGQTYQLSFYLASDGATPSDFSATVGNTIVFSQTNIPYQDYQQSTSTFTATSSSTSLSFAFQSPNGYLQLDSVSVNAVPEPSGLALFGMGLICLASRLRFAKAATTGSSLWNGKGGTEKGT